MEQRVNAKRATAHKHIPDRGEVDPHDGSTWAGIGKMKLKYRDLDSDNHSDNSVDGRIIAGASIDDSHVNGRFTDASLPLNNITGSFNGQPGKLGINDIGGVPDFSNFVKGPALKPFVTAAQVKNMINNAINNKKK